MSKQNLMVAKRLWHGNRFVEVGTPWNEVDTDESPVEERITAHYQATGFLRSKEDLERERNAEAFEARKAAQGSSVALQEAQQKVEDLTSQLETAKADAAKVAGLQTQVAGLQTQVTTLTGQLNAARAQVAKAEDTAALKHYREVVGELLPEGLAPNARKSLTEAGFVGKHLLARVSDEELRALPNVGDGTIEALRKFAPLHVPSAPTPEG